MEILIETTPVWILVWSTWIICPFKKKKYPINDINTITITNPSDSDNEYRCMECMVYHGRFITKELLSSISRRVTTYKARFFFKKRSKKKKNGGRDLSVS